MSRPATTPEPARHDERRKLLHLAGVLGLILAVAIVAVFVFRKKEKPADPGTPFVEAPDEQLQHILAELDRTDPRWRFEDQLRDRERIPDDGTSARTVLDAAGLIPKPWRGPDFAEVRSRLRAGLLDANPRDDIEPANPAVTEARKLAGVTYGRFAVAWNVADPLQTKLAHQPAVLAVVDLLTLDAEVRAHQGDVEGALVSVRAGLGAIRTISDEPMLVSQVAGRFGGRFEYQYACVAALEESLRRGQATEANLLALQTALETEAADQVLRISARAERAGLHGLMSALENGTLTHADPGPLGVRAEGVALILGSERLRQRDSLEAIHGWLLDYTTRLVKITGQPPEAQPPLLKELAESTVLAPPGAIPMAAALPVRELGAMWQRCQALLRCATVGVAVERYRLAHHRLPDSLAELTPEYLGTLPADPYDGKSLRYARHRDVVVVYALGPDGKDDGGKPEALNQFEQNRGYDVGIRLWDVPARSRTRK
jgi:hypothetical protein